MCDPLTIGSMAVGAAGSAYGGYEQNQNQKRMIEARNRATEAELARQRAYGDESRGVFNNVFAGFQPGSQAGALATEQGNAINSFNANTPGADLVGGVATGSGPRVVANAQANTIGNAFARAGRMNTAAGNLAGWDQRQFNNRIGLGRAGSQIGEVGDFSKVSGKVSKLEQDAAYKNAFRPPSGIADLLKFAGRAGSFYGGGGSFPVTTGVGF